MKAQGLPYMNRKAKPVPVPTEENGCGRFAPQSFQEFLLTSGKQLDNIIIAIIIIVIVIITIIIVIIIIIIIITRPKPAYGRRGLAGGSLRTSGAQLESGK